MDTTDGLSCDVISLCQPLLGFVQPSIRGQAARVIYDLSVPTEGKEAVCAVDGCVDRLVKLLFDQSSFVRVQALAALMRCT